MVPQSYDPKQLAINHQRSKPAAGGFVSLADLDASHPPSQPWSKPTWWPRKERLEDGINTDNDGKARHHTTAAVKPRAAVPPPLQLRNEAFSSHRPTLIGTSNISPKNQAELTPEYDEYGDIKSAAVSHGRSRSEAGCITPTIRITPATKHADWPSLTQPQLGRARAQSSLYSQPSPADGVHLPGSLPEARDRSRDSTGTLFEDDDSPVSRSRIVSAVTLFEEDDSPRDRKRFRSSSGASDSKLVIQTSLSNEATRHSLGWWNILTPFLPRSSMHALLRGADDEKDRPSLPSPSFNRSVLDFRDGKEGAEASPVSPDFLRNGRGHTTVFTDMTDWEGQLGKGMFGPQQSPNQEQPPRQGGDFVTRYEEIEADDSATSSRLRDEKSTRGYAHTANQDRKNPFLQPELPVLPRLNTSDPRQGSRSKGSLSPASVAQHHFFSPSDREVPMLFDPITPEATETPQPNQFKQSGAFFDEKSKPLPIPKDIVAPTWPRHDSVMTEFEIDSSPTLHEAEAAPVVRAGQTVEPSPSMSQQGHGHPAGRLQEVRSTQPPPYSPPRTTRRKYTAILPPGHQMSGARPPQSPSPVSPGLQQAMSARGALPMAEISRPAPAHRAYGQNRGLGQETQSSQRGPPLPMGPRQHGPSYESRRKVEARRQRAEKEDAIAKKVGGLWRGRGCFGPKNKALKGGPEARRRRRWMIGLTLGLVAMIILVVTLAMTLTRKHTNESTEQSQWLNITGWPPVPTGTSTVIRPDAVVENTACVFPSTMWSCAVPKELQVSGASSLTDQPDFRMEIRFRNDSSTAKLLSQSNNRRLTRREVYNAASASKFLRDSYGLEARSDEDTRWSPIPGLPTIEDQKFLGNTTDGIQGSRKEGEPTPFYISFLSPAPESKKLKKRQKSKEGDASIPFPDVKTTIPPPDNAPDGTASPANLVPLPDSQPLRLYNRGLGSEHYGFYTYFDRSIFLKSTSLLNKSDKDGGAVRDDANGGSLKSEARVRCTWAQTRFLVQIWTNRPQQALLSGNTTTSTGASSDTARPGSFPYPITITTDRHGGDIGKKLIYCYGMDGNEQLVADQAKIQVENRGFGGKLVGGGQGPLGKTKVTLAQGGLGGIDGGTGGCACQWRNFADSTDQLL
ncbi:MAG: hypothetical protein M1825_006144 [Sarcosagium campestre]|nr:MAG: hypothetical protein M1825_006144 [Sarcosagium campestre]